MNLIDLAVGLNFQLLILILFVSSISSYKKGAQKDGVTLFNEEVDEAIRDTEVKKAFHRIIEALPSDDYTTKTTTILKQLDIKPAKKHNRSLRKIHKIKEFFGNLFQKRFLEFCDTKCKCSRNPGPISDPIPMTTTPIPTKTPTPSSTPSPGNEEVNPVCPPRPNDENQCAPMPTCPSECKLVVRECPGAGGQTTTMPPDLSTSPSPNSTSTSTSTMPPSTTMPPAFDSTSPSPSMEPNSTAPPAPGPWPGPEPEPVPEPPAPLPEPGPEPELEPEPEPVPSRPSKRPQIPLDPFPVNDGGRRQKKKNNRIIKSNDWIDDHGEEEDHNSDDAIDEEKLRKKGERGKKNRVRRYSSESDDDSFVAAGDDSPVKVVKIERTKSKRLGKKVSKTTQKPETQVELESPVDKFDNSIKNSAGFSKFNRKLDFLTKNRTISLEVIDIFANMKPFSSATLAEDLVKVLNYFRDKIELPKQGGAKTRLAGKRVANSPIASHGVRSILGHIIDKVAEAKCRKCPAGRCHSGRNTFFPFRNLEFACPNNPNCPIGMCLCR